MKLGRKGRVALATAAFLLATAPAALFGMAYADGWARTTTATAQGGKIGSSDQAVYRASSTPTAKPSPPGRPSPTASRRSPSRAASPSPSKASPTPASPSPSPTGVEIVIG